MDKGEYITNLFDAIKDKIEYDSDIEALNILLISMFKINKKNSIEMWEYLITNANLSNLSRDVNLMPILNNYPVHIVEELGFKYFYDLVNKLPINKKQIIYEIFFNIYNPKSGINQILENLITTSKEQDEEEIVKLIIQESNIYPKSIFDLNDFLKNIITIHLKNKKYDLKLLEEFTEIPKSAKEKAILKTLLIDYI